MVRPLPALLALALLSVGCPKPRPTHDAARADAATAAARGDASAPRPGDPCDILEPNQRDLIVAQVDDQRLTLCDFTRRINAPNPYLRARFNSPEQRRALLDSWIDAELLASEARARGLDAHPEVRRAVNLQLARRLEQAVRAEVPEASVTDADVRAYYEQHRAEYQTEAQVRASQAVFATRADAERALAELRGHEQDNTLWTRIVRERSVDRASRERDGDLTFFPRAGAPGVPAEVADAAFTLERIGQFLDRVVESAHGGPNNGAGFHVIRLVAKREALSRTLDDEAPRIRARLLRQRREQAEDAAMRALLERLRGASRVEIDDAALARVQVSVPAPVAPPPSPAGAPR